MRYVLLAILFITNAAFAQDHAHHRPMDAAESYSDRSVYLLDAEWLDRQGAPVTLGDFAGGPVLVSMIYTTCGTACPILVHDVQRINHALAPDERARVRVRKLLVSLDHERDTPEVLDTYARQRGVDGSDWTLLTSDRTTIRELATLLGVNYRALPDGTISHSNLITVLDTEGVIRHRHEGLARPVEATVAALSEILDSNE